VTVHLVHGIHSAGATPIEGLIPYLAPLAVAYPDYGWILGAATRIINPAVVGTLKPYIQPNDILVCHSNGCAIAYDLMSMGVKVAGAVFINGALNAHFGRPSVCKQIDVFWNAGDTVTEAAAVGALLGLDDLAWGELGHSGYLGTDSAITNFNCGSTPGMPTVSGHSDFFTPANLAKWGPFLADRVKKWTSPA
jgi:hypothetical protein